MKGDGLTYLRTETDILKCIFVPDWNKATNARPTKWTLLLPINPFTYHIIYILSGKWKKTKILQKKKINKIILFQTTGKMCFISFFLCWLLHFDFIMNDRKTILKAYCTEYLISNVILGRSNIYFRSASFATFCHSIILLHSTLISTCYNIWQLFDELNTSSCQYNHPPTNKRDQPYKIESNTYIRKH